VCTSNFAVNIHRPVFRLCVFIAKLGPPHVSWYIHCSMSSRFLDVKSKSFLYEFQNFVFSKTDALQEMSLSSFALSSEISCITQN